MLPETQWQDFIIDRLITIEMRTIQNQCLLTAIINSLPKEQRKNILKEYTYGVTMAKLKNKNLPEGLKRVY